MSQRFISGQKVTRFPGQLLNYLQERLDSIDRWISAREHDRPPQGDRPRLVVPIVNMTGAALFERAIVGVDKSAFTAPDITEGSGSDPDTNTADAAILTGTPVEVIKPDATTHENKWGVTMGPIAAGSIGWMAITGLVWARVNLTDTEHKFATIETDDTVYLKSASSGMAIWDRKLSGTGKQWALVLLGGGVSGSSSGGVRIGRLAADVDPATGRLAANWADGAVYFQNETTGELDASTTPIKNKYIEINWVEDAQVSVCMSNPPWIIDGTCGPVEWGV